MMAYLEKRRVRSRQGGDGCEGKNATAIATSAYTTEERIKESSRRRAMIEYVMLEGETSSLECAHQLGRLCEGRHLVVNLIPYNATDVKDVLQCPPEAHLHEFKRIVQSYGTFCTIRRTMGADIASACGQLVQKDQEGKDQRTDQEKTTDIEDVVQDGAVTNRSRKPTTTMPGQEEVRYDGAGKVLDATEDQVVGGKESKQNADTFSWMDSLSADELERWSNVLAVATTVSATLFVASAFLYLKRKA
jgi:hypothetical protein